MLFSWEAIMAFVLVVVVYAVAIGDPSFGAMGPLAIGLSLLAMVFAGEPFAPCPALPCPALPWCFWMWTIGPAHLTHLLVAKRTCSHSPSNAG